MKKNTGMAGYTKLFNSILASTIWREDDKTRIVWITLLAMANKDGLAETSLPGLADMARVSIDDCKAAILKLESPDEYSRTKDFEGRRIEPCDGGWRLLNHAKYRAKMSADERREYNRMKQQEWRAKAKSVNAVSTVVNDSQSLLPKSRLSAHTEAEAEAEAEAGTSEVGQSLKKGKASQRGTLDEVKLCCAKVGLPESDAIWFFNKCEGNGWKNGGNPIKSWPHTIAAWKAAGYMPSQKNGQPRTNQNRSLSFD